MCSATVVFALDKHQSKVRRLGIRIQNSINFKGKEKEIERKFCGQQLQAAIFR
jgi:hypothetical protein